MFNNPHARKLIIETAKDYASRPYWLAIYLTGPIVAIIRRQTIPLITATLIDGITQQGNKFSWVKYVVIYVIINLAMMAIGIYGRLTRDKLAESIAIDRWPRYLSQSLSLPYDLLANTPRGEILSKLRAKADYDLQLGPAFSDFLLISLNTIITLLIIFNRSKLFALGYLMIWSVSSYGLYSIAKSRIEVNKTSNAAWDKFNGKTADLIGNAETTIQFGNKNDEIKNYKAESVHLWKHISARWVASRQQQNIISVVQVIMNVMLVVFGIWSVVNGKITIGTFILLQTYVGYAIGDIVGLGDLTRTFVEAITRAISLDEISDKYTQIKEPSEPQKPNIKDMNIEFKNVSFTYSDKNETALKDFSLLVKRGEKIGIVGKSGAGKSTLTKLLLRIYLPNSGEVLIGGKTTEELGSENTRNSIAYVSQEPILFHRTIKENIAYAKPESSDKAIENVAKQSHCMEFISKLPEGFDTVVGDKGIKLSGGQRQRVAIARAILKDAPILVFDEATSALDSESEGIIQDALQNVMKNKTSIVIAHRLSTLKNMDRIVVLEDGKVAEQGTHTELLKNNGTYAKLWEKQSGGFLSV